MNTIDILIKQFPGLMQIPATVAGKAIGYEKQTCYNLISSKRFPLPIKKERRKNMVLLSDLAAYLDGTLETTAPAETPEKPARRPGRPTKAEQRARLNS